MFHLFVQVSSAHPLKYLSSVVLIVARTDGSTMRTDAQTVSLSGLRV